MKIFAFIFILLSVNAIHAQGIAAVPFVRIPPSPLLNGMGEVGTALPNNEAYGFFYNPAQLGFTSQKTNISVQFYPTRMDWLPSFNFSDLTYNSLAVNLGYHFKDIYKALPFSVGVGYMNVKLNLGQNVATDESGNELGTFNSYERYHALGIGIGFNYYIQLSMGFTYKSIESNLSSKNLQVGSEVSTGRLVTHAIDYGVLLVVPVLKYFTDTFCDQSDQKSLFLPFFDFSIGYAKTNIGDRVLYIDLAEPDPLPRMANFGYALSAGFRSKIKHQWITVLALDWSVDARDMLIQKNENRDYQTGFLGDIGLGKNVLSANSDENVDVYKGYRLKFFEVLQVTNGEWDGAGWSNPKTSGYALRLKGVFKLLYAYSDDKLLKYIANHFDFQYAHSEIKSGRGHPLSGTVYSSFRLAISGF